MSQRAETVENFMDVTTEMLHIKDFNEFMPIH